MMRMAALMEGYFGIPSRRLHISFRQSIPGDSYTILRCGNVVNMPCCVCMQDFTAIKCMNIILYIYFNICVYRCIRK